MAHFEGLNTPFEPNWQGLVDNILRKGTPQRVHFIELFQDPEVSRAIVERFGLADDLDPSDPNYHRKRYIAVQRFCGFDYVFIGLADMAWPMYRQTVEDTAVELSRGVRSYQDEHSGPIMSWEDFEKYPWPDPHAPAATRELEWYQENLPEGMGIIGGGIGHYAEFLTWLMGYETFCFALYDQRDLVEAMAARLREFDRIALERILQFDRVRMVWGSDDMGFKTGLLFSADDMREFVLSGHRALAAQSHAAGRPYLLHSCGNLHEIMDDIIEDVQVDAKHSFEDVIEDVRELKHTYGQKIALLGGIDLDFLCRATPEQIRARVRATLDTCMPGGGYCLGTGNSVANYIPLDSYLTMVDEGRLYTR